MKIRNIIGGILLVALSGCGHFLDEYSQTFIRASKISDYDELLLGSVYIKSIQPNIAQMYYVYPSGNNVCGFFNVLDDDVSTVCVDEYTMIGGFSMGGLMALYAAISYHTYFSKAACLSSSIGICLEALKDEINQHDSLKDTRLFLSWGSEESRNKRALAYASMNQLDISHLLNLKGVQTYPYLLVNGRHHMISWQQQIPLLSSKFENVLKNFKH